MDVVNNKRQYRFEIALPGGEYATLEYRWLKAKMALMHTIVPKAAQGQGIGSLLVKYVLDYARAQNLEVLPYCPFVARYIKEHPEYATLVGDSGR